jgi:transcriptional regulator with XRE-family HTH domain
METAGYAVGDLLREWRQRRHMSQLALANQAEISSRHLSFIETGRSQPSREMVLHLAEELAIPIRERNVLLVAAGYAPIFTQSSLDDPALAAARRAVDLVLEAQSHILRSRSTGIGSSLHPMKRCRSSTPAFCPSC